MTTSRYSRLCVILLAGIYAVAQSACAKDNTDAWGTFESTETRVSSELPGRVLKLDAIEGGTVTAGSVVAQMDTSALVLQRHEQLANQAIVRAKTREVDANIMSVEGQLMIAQREFERVTRLKAAEAATAQQVDNALKTVTILTQQIEAFKANRSVISEEVKSTEASLAAFNDHFRKARVVTPVSGTVLTRFVQPGEYAQAGAALFSVATLDTLVFRAYLDGEQLTKVHVGSQLFVRTDAGSGTLQMVPGTVTWISTTAEFTPTPIQTRKERTTQVYAIKLSVANLNHALRIGMPGELRFTADSSSK